MLAAGASTAWAAGLGRLTVQSALGQPLRAEVEITSLSRDEAASLSAKLAPQDAFRQAGMEFNPALSSLRFVVERGDDGRSFVRISSTQPINEPFVDLLVELNWTNGRLVREYTFLLDPPELRVAGRNVVDGGNTQSAVVPAATAPAAQSAQTAPVPAPVASSAPAVPAPAPAAQTQPAPAAASPAQPTAPARAQPEAAAKAAGAAGGAPILVKRGDTLAAIARGVKPGGVSLDQAMIAFYQANPSAFFGGVNRLLAGATLAVPDAQTMASVDAAKASEQVRAHTRDFAAYRARLAESTRSVSAAKGGQSAAGAVGGKVEDRAAPASGDKLALSRTEAPASAPAGGAGTTTTRSAAVEQSVARDAALRESQSRVAELEKNVGDLQKLLELKNRQLAELQKQVESAGSAASAAGTIAKTAPAAASAPVATPGAAQSAGATSVSPPAVAEAPKAAPESGAKTDTAPPAAKGEPAAAAPKAAPEAAPKAAPAAPADAAQPGFLGDLADNPLLLPGLGALLALGAGYGWYAMRRRRKVEKFEDSLIAGEGFASNSLFGSTGGQSVDTASSMFAATGKDSAVDVHSTEVDPIAEAEVYIAYGRESQAEEILREALKKQPERQAIRAKLLEIYSGRKDLGAFNDAAGEMHAMTGGQNEEWPKVVTMGLALDPDNALYTGREPTGEVAADEVSADDVAAVDDATVDALFASEQPAGAGDDARNESPASAGGRAPAAEAAQDVDFGLLETPADFSDTRPLADRDLIGKSDVDAGDPGLDFDLDLDLDTTVGKAGERIASTRDRDGDGRSELEQALDSSFELPVLDLDAPSKASGLAAAEQALEDLPHELPSIDEPEPDVASRRAASPSPAAPRAASPAAAAVSEMDLSAIGLDLAPAGSGANALDESRWQEMATKLDLASAYEEIGDKEGARELLDEVVKGGDGEQQHKARAMLSKLA